MDAGTSWGLWCASWMAVGYLIRRWYEWRKRQPKVEILPPTMDVLPVTGPLERMRIARDVFAGIEHESD